MIVKQKWTVKYPVHKSRSIPDVVAVLKGNETYNASCALQSTAPQTSCITKQETESIVYTGGMPGHTRQGANACVHGKYIRQYTGITAAPCVVVTLKSNPCVHTNYYHVHQTLAESYHTLAETEFAASHGLTTGTGLLFTNAQAWANKIYLDLKPDLNKFSLPNDIIDWRQLGDLAKIWRKGSSLVNQVAGARLNYKFGWKPTIGDLKALAEIVLELRGKLAHFKYSRGSIISSRKRLLKESVVKIGNVLVDGNTHRGWRGQIDRQVEGYLVYEPLPIVVMGELDEILRGLLAATGFELNPSIVWDAIPFTFVIDWFVNVGKFLDAYKHSALELPIRILQVFMQNKESIQVDSWVVWNDDANYSFRPGQTAGTSSKTKFFHRLPWWPDLASFASLETKWPTPSQAINLVALGTVLNAGKINTFSRAIRKGLGANQAMNGPFGKLVSYFDYDTPSF